MTTSIRLEPEQEKRIEALAARTGQTKDFHVRQLIEQGLQDLEDYYEAVEISERVRRGEEKTYTWAEVKRNLALDD
jgi:RHH-type transcriptional regulator, rel operon repressor / antitoxin RelB